MTKKTTTTGMKTTRVKVKTGLKGGGISAQHNRALKVRAGLKAGGISAQHNRRLLEG